MMCLDPTDNGDYVLSWNQGKTIFQVPSDRNVNLLMIRGRSVCKGFDAFAAVFHCQPTGIPNNNDDYEVEATIGVSNFEPKQVQFTDDIGFGLCSCAGVDFYRQYYWSKAAP